MIRRHVLVHGIVQGVGFRFSARREAERLGVAGWARNRPDGTVEAEVEGDEASVAAMLDWLATGPRGAVVERTDVAVREPTGQPGFRITG
ncbi:acylphosphatase [Agromyces fucosus]|uniref:Acylphosphatase n=1 Tax=Agromyces fucosus TaxID=41985 RepID=A0A4Q2JQD5_9MICO|nr:MULTISPECIES: acylphosphatase [Agromyces]KQZ11001.1 acylphosphatase [Agromyces sp. Root1464]RXZ48939.1 acylphosphatase [Agromyces fucosus]